MKILFMADVPCNPDSGAAGTEYQTIEAMRTLGHDVEAVWADELSSKISHGNLHYILELPRTYEKQMLNKFRHKSFDVIHVNQPHGYRAAQTLQKLKRQSIFIHRSHGLEMRHERELSAWQKVYHEDPRSYPRRLASKVMSRALAYNSRSIARFADGHIVSARQCKDFMRENLCVPEERIAVIPQAPPLAFSERAPAAMTAERLNHVLYVGQYDFVKAPMIVAEVINRLSEANERLEFTWVCAQQHHVQVQELLSPEARKRIDFLDWMPQDELMRVYDEHGIFLFPSFVEGFGKVFLEAMSRGLCVVAADNSGAHDVIADGVNGMLSPTGCLETMVSQCLQLAQPSQSAYAISAAAAKSARSYTWERVATETVSFYHDRLNAKARELNTVRID
ncbi:MAG TPA: glycosyltransferase family 4 protein [Pyrinomonadaceae bacterium]|nr:glycosyltransferase family 4 protein [Pyrinomonadaceae bacterium]